MSSFSEIKQILNLAIIGVVSVFGFLYLRSESGNIVVRSDERLEDAGQIHLSSIGRPKSSQVPQSPDSLINEKVNQYMQEVQRKLTTSELRSLNQLQGLVPRPHAASLSQVAPRQVDPAAVPREAQIWKEPSPQSASSVIQNRIVADEKLKFANEQARREYAKQFIENARRNGYHITLSPEMEVLSVEPIRDIQSEYDAIDQNE